MKKLALISILALSTACNTVTIRPDGIEKNVLTPDLEERQHFFAWGLAPGARYVDVNAACNGKEIDQMQTQDTFLDGFLTLITLGIYSPRTARVWCKN